MRRTDSMTINEFLNRCNLSYGFAKRPARVGRAGRGGVPHGVVRAGNEVGRRARRASIWRPPLANWNLKFVRGDHIEAVAIGNGRLDLHGGALKILASLVVVSTDGAVGREGGKALVRHHDVEISQCGDQAPAT